jgi:hypothetical protein
MFPQECGEIPVLLKIFQKNQKTFEKGIDKCEWIWYYY